MGGSSGKQSTSTQSVQIPQDVLNRYNAANDAASTAAAQPFQQYSTSPDAFVAPLNSTQNAGVAGTNAAAGIAQPYFSQATQQLQDAQSLGAGMTGSAQTALLNAKTNANPYNTVAGNDFNAAYAGAQPYNQAATGLAAASAQAVDPSQLDGAAINKYLSPYLQNVLGGTAAQLNQDNQKAMSGQTGSAISQGAFGGDRAGLAAATLAGQQQLANAQIYSGILNTGYNNALGAAQQQQGVGLGAAQANRAALAGAGQQLQSIGQQQYGQGTTTGQAQQGLGQQVFGQGLSTSQQEAALGQQEYGMGANTSQQLAGLGAGAQTAALQGAQAQLAAGQVGQQTTQAGDTALYNQFLQQQSYPFQTAQFLANVAEGTGSLSGSTTTTTQPGGFFSDERLKEDIKKIGKTFDGQVIYSFKYKGDPRTQVGLMAQDVEKKTPDAVGESHGYKTVDYDKATERSAERGHFAGGGAPMLPGLSGADMSALLQAQEQMYAPFSQAGGLYGGQSGGMPRGGYSYVPQGNLPVSHLAVAGGLAPRKSTAESVKDIADTASKAAPYAQKAEDWIKEKWSARNDNTMSANENDLATGGLVPAKKYASGGMPYDPQTGLDIPDETPTSKLQTAGDLPGQKSGMSDVKDAAGTALAVAKLAAMFMNRGGRAGFADGGSPGFDDTVDFATAGDGGGAPWYLKPVPSPEATGHAIMQGLRGAGSAFLADQDKRRAQSRDFTDTGDTDTPAPHVGTPVGPIKTAAPSGLAAPRRAPSSGGLAPAVAATDAELPTITAKPPTGGLAAQPVPQGDNLTTQAIAPTDTSRVAQGSPGVLSRIASGLGDGVKDYATGLKHGDAQNWLPLISAIAAAGTAPTVHPGVALAAGLGAGAQSYMGTKKALADVARTGAETQRIETGTNIANAPAPVDGYTWVPGKGPNGEGIPGKDGKSVWHREMNVNATNFGSPQLAPQAAAVAAAATHAPPSMVAPSHDTDAAMQSQYHVDPSQPGVANHDRAIALNPQLAPLDDAARKAVQDRVGDLQANDNSRRQLVQLAGAVNALSSGPTGQGHGSDYRTHLTNILTTAGQYFGVPVDASVTSDLSNQQIIAKIKELAGPQIANQSNQHAASVAHAITGVLPGGDLQPAAANEILSTMLVANQQPRDLSSYANNYAGRYGLMVNVEPSFQHDAGPIYDREQKILPVFMSSAAFAPALADLQSSDEKVRNRAVRTLDAAYGPNFHRYFTGGQ